MVVRVLAVSDEVVESLWSPEARRLRPDLVVAAGDLPFDYLDYLASTCDVPLVLVPGNHDPDLSGFRHTRRGLTLRAGIPTLAPSPPGAVNADGRVVDVAGLRVAGLGGSPRYRPGPNQYTQAQQARRARRLARRSRWLRRRDGREVDILLVHAPPRGVGDRDDPAHRGFVALHDAVARMRPRYLLHGHVHPFGVHVPEQVLGTTRIVNVVGAKLIEVPRPPHRPALPVRA